MCNEILSSEQVVERIRECFLQAGMPVFYTRIDDENHPGLFLSLYRGDSGDFEFFVDYDETFRSLMFSCVLPQLPDGLSEPVRNIMLRTNEARGHCYCAPCPNCSRIELKGALYIPESGFPEKKLDRLLSWILGEITRSYPLVIKTVEKGGDMRIFVRRGTVMEIKRNQEK